MRIVVDLQSCQNGSADRGIGRYALAMTRAMVRNGRDRHSFRLMLSDRFPERVGRVRAAFADLLEPQEIVVVAVPDKVSSATAAHAWRTRAAELVWREALTALAPDAYFTPSLFEGYRDDAVTMIEAGGPLSAAVIHDLIPLDDPAVYLPSEPERAAYGAKVTALRRCDRLFAVSAHSRQEAIRRLGLDPARILVAPLGTEPEFCPADVMSARRVDLLRRYRIRDRFLITASPFEARKNLEGLIAGFGTLPDDVRSGVQLVICGKMDRHARETLWAWAEREGLRRSDVVLPGYVPDPDLIDLYRLCEAMVFPSLSEGFGLPPLEAMACGAPVLAAAATSLPEVMGRSDALFDPTRPGDIGRAIERVLTDDVFRADLRAFGPERAATFSWDRSAACILETLETAYARRCRAADVSTSTLPLVSQPLRRLAVIIATGAPQARESAVIRDYVRRLSSAFDLSLFSLEGDLGQDVTLPLATRPVADFLTYGGTFDRALYIVDSERAARALPIIQARPGIVILVEPLLASSGMAAKAPERLLACAPGAAVESDSPFAGAPGMTTVAPRVVVAEPGAQLAWRQAHGIPADAELWAAFVADDEAGKVAVQAFRRRDFGPGPTPWLAVIPAQTALRPGPMPGREAISPEGFAGSYAAALGAASAVMICPRLPAATRSRLEEDARAAGRKRLSDAFVISPMSGGGDEGDWSPAQDDHFLTTISRLLREAGPPHAPGHGATATFPAIVGDQRPAAADLRDVATALVLNAEWMRPGRILVDVTTPVRLGRSGLDGLSRRLLRRLFELDGDLIPVARDDDGWFIASGLQGDLTGAAGVGDEVFQPREADRLVSVDLFDGGLDPSTTDQAGVRSVAVELMGLTLARPDLVEEIAAALVEAVHAEISTSAVDVSGGPVRRTASASRVALRLAADAGETGARLAPAALALARSLSRPPPPLDPRLDLSFTMQGHVRGSYSLALVNRRVARVLDEALPGRVDYAPVETHPVTDITDVPDDDRTVIDRLMIPAPRGQRHVALCQHWPVLPPAGQADLGLALVAWEESHLPGDMVRIFNGSFDGLLAQVRSVQKALVDSGVHVPTALTGLPMDIGPYEGVCRRDGPARRFLHVSSCFPRKGVDVLLEAWARAFTARDGVTLTIKTFPNPHNDVHAQLFALSQRHPEMAPVQVLNIDMDRDELIDLYRDADVMVLPTRGEGYNLPALEAMAAGLPLIVTGYGGQTDFCGPADARQLDYAFALSGSHVRDSVAYWVEPSVEDLVAALREQVAPDQQPVIEARRRRARLSARAAVDPGRWTRVVTEFAALLAGPVDTGPVPTDWISTWGLRCGIAEYSRFLIDHMAPEWRTAVTVVADDRTETGPAGVAWRHGWGAGGHHAPERLLSDIAARDPEAVILQHQDGLIEWVPLAALLESDVLSARTTLVELHVVRTLERLPEADLRRVVAALSRADRLLVHTTDDLNRLKGYGLIDNVALFPHGATRPEAPPPPVRALGPASAPVIGCHGFLFHHKRVDALIRAAAELRGRWPGLRLSLVNASFGDEGSAAALQHAREVAAEVGMADAIDWVTDFLPVEEIRARLAGCDLLVLPYDETGDSSSGAVRVAMSAQVPTLTTTAKIFDDVADAVAQVESNAPAELAAAMARLLESPEQRARVQGRIVRWLELHDWRRMASQLEGIVKALAYARRREARGAGGL